MMRFRPRLDGASPFLIGLCAAIAVSLVGASGILPLPSAAADVATTDSSSAATRALYPHIVNGESTFSHPETGALLMYDDSAASSLSGLCSGTLIGCQTFLTAAHCVCPDGAYDAQSCARRGTTDPATLRVFFQQGGLLRVAAVSISPDYSFAERGDVAVVTLAEPITGIAPSAINTLRKPEVGSVGAIVGFGTTSAGRRTPDDAGIKRQGAITTAPCPSDIPADTHVCWSFLGSQSNTCEGDSGGPLFADFGSGAVVAAVTSGGNSFDCLAPDTGFDSDVFVNRAWIVATAGADLGNESCGLPAAGSASTAMSTSTGLLSGASPEAALQVDVAEGTSVLRVGLNGQLGSATSPDTSNDFDLFVRADGAPTSSTFDCTDTDPSPFGFCEIDSPRAGTWNVLVRRNQGDGAFQVTATTFAAAAPTACVGDCNHDGDVTVDEVLEGVRIALGSDDLATCPAFNGNAGGEVTVAEVLAAVTSVLGGCPAS